jgi:hypothetical protein
MILSLLLLACSEGTAEADVPPTIDDIPVEDFALIADEEPPELPSDAPVLVADREHVENADAPSPEELIDADTVVTVSEEDGVSVSSPQVITDPVVAEGVLLRAGLPYCQPLPGGGPSFMEKWGAEIWLFIVTGWIVWRRRQDIDLIVNQGLEVIKAQVTGNQSKPARLDPHQARAALSAVAEEMAAVARDAKTDRDRLEALYQSALKSIEDLKAERAGDLSGAKTISEAREQTRKAGESRLFG